MLGLIAAMACPGGGQGPADPGQDHVDGGAVVATGVREGVEWELRATARTWRGRTAATMLMKTANDRSEFVLVLENSLAAVHYSFGVRRSMVHVEGVGFVIGLAGGDIDSVQVRSAGVPLADGSPVAVAGLSARAFILAIPPPSGRLRVRGLDANGEVVAVQVLPRRPSDGSGDDPA